MPGDTKRSKVEDKLTEEKLIDRESAAHPNTPWAPSGPERIYWAQGFPGLPGFGAVFRRTPSGYCPDTADKSYFGD